MFSHSPMYSRSYINSSAATNQMSYYGHSPSSPQDVPSQMWSSAVTNDDYGSPKSGTLPAFQRIASSSASVYSATTQSASRNTTSGYTTQVCGFFSSSHVRAKLILNKLCLQNESWPGQYEPPALAQFTSTPTVASRVRPIANMSAAASLSASKLRLYLSCIPFCYGPV